MRPEHGGVLKLKGKHQAQWPIEKTQWLDFSVNLNPFAILPTAEQWGSWLQLIEHYPPATTECVDSKIANYLGIPNEEQVIATNGGMEAIRFSVEMCSRGKKQAVYIPCPAFSEYGFLCEQRGLTCVYPEVPHERWSNADEWLNFEFERDSTVVIGNPNNPVGGAIQTSDLETVLREFLKKNIHLIVDEAFVDLTSDCDTFSARKLIDSFPNLTIVGSLTKSWSIPGLRLGYLLSSNQDILSRTRDAQITWPLNSLAVAWSQEMLTSENKVKHNEGVLKIAQLREQLRDRLEEFPFLNCFHSEANYLMCECTLENGKTGMIEHLNNEHIHVRCCDSIAGVPLGRFFRVAVRQPNESGRLIAALERFAHSVCIT